MKQFTSLTTVDKRIFKQTTKDNIDIKPEEGKKTYPCVLIQCPGSI